MMEEDSIDWGNSTHPEMTACWNHLPLVPLGIILQHLSPKDALQATAVCRHWRSALSHYHGHRETIKLNASYELERSVLVARIFRKNARRLRVLLDGSPCQVEQFFTCVVPLFLDASKLQEVFFIGPMTSDIEDDVNISRSVIENLIYKQLDSLKHLAMVGCDLETPLTERYTQNKRINYFPQPLTLSQEISQTASALQHLLIDYDQINTLSLKTMSSLRHLSRLSLFIFGEKHSLLSPIDWLGLRPCFPHGLDVAVVGIDLTEMQMEDITHNVLVDGMNLVSLKMLFCKSLYCPILFHLADKYKTSLREVVWADAPHPKHEKFFDDSRFYYDRTYRELMTTCDMNPFIIMCWQCKSLRRIVIHGYWTWQYDIVGFFRMRPTLERVEVSAVRRGPSPRQSSRALRVRVGDRPARLAKKLIMKINEYTGYKWSPIAWDALHPGLKSNSTEEQRADYALEEATNSSWTWIQ